MFIKNQTKSINVVSIATCLSKSDNLKSIIFLIFVNKWLFKKEYFIFIQKKKYIIIHHFINIRYT